MKQSWKVTGKPPRILATAIRRGLKLADSLSVETADDRSWIRITFKKHPVGNGIPPDKTDAL